MMAYGTYWPSVQAASLMLAIRIAKAQAKAAA